MFRWTKLRNSSIPTRYLFAKARVFVIEDRWEIRWNSAKRFNARGFGPDFREEVPSEDGRGCCYQKCTRWSPSGLHLDGNGNRSFVWLCQIWQRSVECNRRASLLSDEPDTDYCWCFDFFFFLAINGGQHSAMSVRPSPMVACISGEAFDGRD